MDIIVHIGAEKTGTTTLQELLHNNRDRLIAEGFYFLKSPGLYNNRDLPAYCMGDDQFDDYFRSKGIDTLEKKQAFREDFRKRFLEEIDAIPNNVKTVIASSEHFHSRLVVDEEVERLKELLAERFKTVKIVTYLRKQVDTAISFYSTALKNGQSIAFMDFMKIYCNSAHPYFDYFAYIKRWEKVFGKDHMIVRIFERSSFMNESLVEDFFGLIHPTLSARIDTNIQSQNEAINQFGQCLLRSVNKYVPQLVDGIGFNMNKLHLVQIIIDETKGNGICMSPEEYETMQAQFKEGNEALAREYFPDRENLFENRLLVPGHVILTEQNEMILDKVIGALSNHPKSEFQMQLSKELHALRDNRDTLHEQLISLSARHGQLQKEFNEVEAELQFLKAGLMNRALLKLRAKFRASRA